MEENKKFCTSVEQSNRLLELGLSPSTADMSHNRLKISEGGNPNGEYLLIPDNEPDSKASDILDIIPAWSFNALMSLMPQIDGEYPQVLRCNNYPGQWYGTTKRFGKYKGDGYSDPLETFQYDNPVEPAYVMLCWLLDEKQISFGNLQTEVTVENKGKF